LPALRSNAGLANRLVNDRQLSRTNLEPCNVGYVGGSCRKLDTPEKQPLPTKSRPFVHRPTMAA